jgi:hypothetical protein
MSGRKKKVEICRSSLLVQPRLHIKTVQDLFKRARYRLSTRNFEVKHSLDIAKCTEESGEEGRDDAQNKVQQECYKLGNKQNETREKCSECATVGQNEFSVFRLRENEVTYTSALIAVEILAAPLKRPTASWIMAKMIYRHRN